MHGVRWEEADDSICQPAILMCHTICHFGRCLLSNWTWNAIFVLDLGYPINMANVMQYCEQRHPWLLEYFKTILRCRRQMGGSIWNHSASPFMSCTSCHFHRCQLSNFTQNAGFRVPSQHGKCDMLYCKEIQPLLFEFFKTFLSCIGYMGGNFWQHSVSPLWVTACHIHQGLLSNCTQNIKILGTLSAHQMWYCTARRDSHCCLSVL